MTKQAREINAEAQVRKSLTGTLTINTQEVGVSYLSLIKNPLNPICFMSATCLLLMSLLQLLFFLITYKINFHALNFDEEPLEINHKQS